MLRTLKLLLPALIPSWRFFDAIAPSPRIEYVLLTSEMETPDTWREFRPRPERVSVSVMLGRMFWNPRWNESLFLVSCAERLMENPTKHSRDEIFARISAEFLRFDAQGEPAPFVQYRLVFVSRQGAAIQKSVTYVSPVRRLAEANIS